MSAEPLPPGWRRVTSHDGTGIAWRVDGPAGDVAVILCNGICCDDTYFTHVWAPLAQTAPVVRWHYRGHGFSQRPAHPDAVTVAACVGDLAAVMDAAEVDRAVLVGHSYGVQLVFEAWQQLTGRVAGIAAVAGAYGHPITTIRGWNPGVVVFDLMRWCISVPGAEALWDAALRSPVAFSFARMARFAGPKAARDDMARWFDHLADRDMRLMFRMMREMQAHTTEDLLPQVDVPVVVMPGGSDPYTPPRLWERVVPTMRDARLVVVPGATHVLPIEEPQLVVDEVRVLLRRAGGRAPPP